MALKFLNKKGWHTGSLRNIENVWKAEQKHEGEQKKLEELRKQIQEERERSEFRLLQEQAGLVPRQERLDFLYESGLAVGKGSSDGFKALEAPAAAEASASTTAAAESGSSKAAVPGALFEDKPQSANDSWRKLHSDPLLLIRQREQEALARIKNNPIKMAMIRKSVEAEKQQQDNKGGQEKKKHKKKHRHSKSNNVNSDSENMSEGEEDRKKRARHTSERHGRTEQKHRHSKSNNVKNSDSENMSEGEEDRKKRDRRTSERQGHTEHKHLKHSSRYNIDEEDRRTSGRLVSEHNRRSNSKHEKHSSRVRSDSRYTSESEEERKKGDYSTTKRQHQHGHSKHLSKLCESEDERGKHNLPTSEHHRPNAEKSSNRVDQQGPGYNRRRGVQKMTAEEREARLREMQLNAELHEEQRWKRVKKAAEADAREVMQASSSGGKNFLDAAQKSIYGTEKGGSSTIEESVRRRAHYSQGGSAANESNAFRR